MRNELLARVLEAASATFNREVHPSDNFYAVGGDSLAAVELALRLEEGLDREVDAEMIFEADDFVGLAAALCRTNADEVGTA